MDMITLIDTSPILCARLCSAMPERQICLNSEKSGFVLVNGDNCSGESVAGIDRFGLVLLSGNVDNVATELLTAEKVFFAFEDIVGFIAGSGATKLFSAARCFAAGYLNYIGMPPSLCGFKYLSHLIAKIALGEGNLKAKLLPEMAKTFSTTPAAIERAMRYAIETTWLHGDLNAQTELFGYTISPERGKPVTLELASLLSILVREDLKNDRLRS